MMRSRQMPREQSACRLQLHVMGWHTVNSCRGRIDTMCEDDACGSEVCVNSLCGHIEALCEDDACWRKSGSATVGTRRKCVIR